MTEQPLTQSQPQDQPQDQPQAAPPPYRRLVRSRTDAPLTGVCGGLADYLGVDPTVVRVLAVVLGVFTFPVGPLLYVLLAAVMPRQ